MEVAKFEYENGRSLILLTTTLGTWTIIFYSSDRRSEFNIVLSDQLGPLISSGPGVNLTPLPPPLSVLLAVLITGWKLFAISISEGHLRIMSDSIRQIGGRTLCFRHIYFISRNFSVSSVWKVWGQLQKPDVSKAQYGMLTIMTKFALTEYCHW